MQVLEEGFNCVVDFAIGVASLARGGEVFLSGAGGPGAGVAGQWGGGRAPLSLVLVVVFRAKWAVHSSCICGPRLLGAPVLAEPCVPRSTLASNPHS